MDVAVRKCIEALSHYEHGRAVKHAGCLAKVKMGYIVQSFVSLDAMYVNMNYTKPNKLFGKQLLRDMLNILYLDCLKQREVMSSTTGSSTISMQQQQQQARERVSFDHSSAFVNVNRLVKTPSIDFGTLYSHSSNITRRNSSKHIDQATYDYILSLPTLILELIRVRLLQYSMLKLSKCTRVTMIADLIPEVSQCRASINFESLSALSPTFSIIITEEFLTLENILEAHKALLMNSVSASMACLYAAKHALQAWKLASYPTTHQERSFRTDFKSRLTFSSLPSHMLFWNRLVDNLLASATFIFHSALSFGDLIDSANTTSFTTTSAYPITGDKLCIDYLDMISTMHKKNLAASLSVILIYITLESDPPVDFNGYTLMLPEDLRSSQDNSALARTGLALFPILFFYPKKPATSEHIAIVSIYTKSTAITPLHIGNIISFTDTKLSRSYHTLRLTERHLLCVLMSEPTHSGSGDTRSRPNDALVFLQSITRTFAGTHILSELVFK